MRNRIITTVALLACALCWASAHGQDAGQASGASQPPAPNKASSSKDKANAAGASSAANPGQSTAPDAPQPNAPQPNASPNAPQPNAPANAPQPNAAKKPSTADDNPFPEAVSSKAAAAAKAEANSPSVAAPASTATAKGSSSLDGVDKLGLDDEARRKLKLESPDGSPDTYDPKRATEDVRVGKFYLRTGDYKGAYDRFKDATVFDHEDVEAVFWLAESARKVDHPQEAAQNYQLYLAAVPDGPNAKAARKALGELSASSKLSDQHP